MPCQVSATAPPTGQHTVEDDLRDEALSYFFKPEQQARTAPTTGGVNNIVQYVNTADGQRYILRIYNNGNKTEKVEELDSGSNFSTEIQLFENGTRMAVMRYVPNSRQGLLARLQPHTTWRNSLLGRCMGCRK